MDLQELKTDVCRLKTDMVKVCNDLSWIKRIGGMVSGAIVAIFIKVMFF